MIPIDNLANASAKIGMRPLHAWFNEFAWAGVVLVLVAVADAVRALEVVKEVVKEVDFELAKSRDGRSLGARLLRNSLRDQDGRSVLSLWRDAAFRCGWVRRPAFAVLFGEGTDSLSARSFHSLE